MIPRMLWLRLIQTESRSHCVQRPFVFLKHGETQEVLDRKIRSWLAGEVVDGISDVYQGGEVEFFPIEFVRSRHREGHE